jgi:hypothetical protein
MNVTKGPWDDVRQGGFTGGGQPPHDGNMEPRVARLETAVDRIDQDLTAIKVSIARIETRLENVATKTWVLGGAIAVLVALVGGFWWIAQQYLAPILAAAGKH